MATWSAAMGVLQWVWICGPGAHTGTSQPRDSELRWGARRQRGQSMIEYALIFLLVILGLIIVLVFFGPQIGSEYHNISNNL